MHRAVDLDEVVRTLRDREHVEALVADAQPQLEPARSLDVDVDRLAVEVHVIPIRPGPGHPQPVGLTAGPDVDLERRLVPDLGTAALGGGEQVVLLPSSVRLVRLDAVATRRRRPAAAACTRRPSSCRARSCRPRRG